VIKRSLDEARAELQQLQSMKNTGGNDAMRQVEGLKEQLSAMESQTSLLKDSNQVLRENADKLQDALSRTQTELDEAKRSLQPDEKAKHDQSARMTMLTSENESLRRDLDEWKNRVKSIVSKFNQVDPVEHSQLKKSVENLNKENESLRAWKRTTEEENTRMRTIATKLKEKNMGLQKEIESINAVKLAAVQTATAAETTAAIKERDEFKAKVVVLIASRCVSCMVRKYNHDKWHTNSIGYICLQHSLNRRMWNCKCHRNYYSKSIKYCITRDYKNFVS
jgi:nucleoprotein TPR